MMRTNEQIKKQIKLLLEELKYVGSVSHECIVNQIATLKWVLNE